MGKNKIEATPEAYPTAFLSAIRNGGAILYTADLPWSALSAQKRFRLLLRLLRSLPDHELHQKALPRWHVTAHSAALEVRPSVAAGSPLHPSPSGDLVKQALRGLN